VQEKLRKTMEEEEAKQKARALERDLDELRVRRP
jgi:hypothetical protein